MKNNSNLRNEYISNIDRKVFPQIYAYRDESFPNYIKVGYTTRQDVNERIKEQYVNRPRDTYKLLWFDDAMREDGTTFTDKEVHEVLEKNGFRRLRNKEDGTKTEFFECKIEDVQRAYEAVKKYEINLSSARFSFKMRQEQEEAVNITYNYFVDRIAKNEIPHFLWNCKMRFGKTFATYELAKKMNASKILVLTFKPAVEDQWKRDLFEHIDFEGWQFASKNTIPIEKIDQNKPFVCFGSLQDYLGLTKTGTIKETNETVFKIKWDLIVLDEYHFGAWNDRTTTMTGGKNVKLSALDKSANNDELREIKEQEIFDKETGESKELSNAWNEKFLKSACYLYLSGTPFRALANGDFMEDQIYNWTYADEQKRKSEFIKNGFDKPENNPYLSLPEIVFFTYQLPLSVVEPIENYGQNEFTLSEFFKAEGTGKDAKFIHQNEVQKFLDILRNKFPINDTTNPNAYVPALPYNDVDLMNICNHQMWLLPNISSCDAMENLLRMKQNDIYNQRRIINASGNHVGNGIEALIPVREAIGMNGSDSTKGTIILTCGKLCTGVTIPQLTSIFMLSNCNAPETYFQSAFRIQSPRTTKNDRGETIILKDKCYIFDFAPARALNLIVEYASKLDNSNKSVTQKIDSLLGVDEDGNHFLPVLQYDGASFNLLNASDILEVADHGQTATMLAKRWNSNTLIDISNEIIEKILNNPEALKAIENIEGWRNDNTTEDMKILINKSKNAEKLRAKGDKITPKEKKELTEIEKERRNRRAEIQKKLKQFIRRIPIFMYLSEFREQTLNDVITKFEPNLFKKVTGLTVKDFELLKEIGLFVSDKLDMAVLYFKRYEDSSLLYTGIDKHIDDRNVGLFYTSISKEEYENFDITKH